MDAFDRPIILGINGVAATGGIELALMGDILLASSDARFADTHCRVGLEPGWGLSGVSHNSFSFRILCDIGSAVTESASGISAVT
jgi:enoyl-CoA hydratase/carnithine racemase